MSFWKVFKEYGRKSRNKIKRLALGNFRVEQYCLSLHRKLHHSNAFTFHKAPPQFQPKHWKPSLLNQNKNTFENIFGKIQFWHKEMRIKKDEEIKIEFSMRGTSSQVSSYLWYLQSSNQKGRLPPSAHIVLWCHWSSFQTLKVKQLLGPVFIEKRGHRLDCS